MPPAELQQEPINLWDPVPEPARSGEADGIFAAGESDLRREADGSLGAPPRRPAGRRPAPPLPRAGVRSAVVSLVATCALLGAIVAMTRDEGRPPRAKSASETRPRAESPSGRSAALVEKRAGRLARRRSRPGRVERRREPESTAPPPPVPLPRPLFVPSVPLPPALPATPEFL